MQRIIQSNKAALLLVEKYLNHFYFERIENFPLLIEASRESFSLSLSN